MAPVKNPNTTNKNSFNTNSLNHNSISNSPSSISAATNATHSNHSSNAAAAAAGTQHHSRKQTGTVPKSSTKSTGNSNATQKPLLQPAGVAQMANRCSPLNIVASIQQQQQQQQHNQRQQQQHKNTEIVAPIRRELKDLNVSFSKWEFMIILNLIEFLCVFL